MSEKLRVVTKKPGIVNAPQVQEIEDSLEAMQALVTPEGDTGYHLIERVSIQELEEKGIDLYVNEEGKFNGCKPNFMLWGGVDVAMGPVFFVGFDGEGGSTSLTDEQVTFVQAWLHSQPLAIGL